MARLAVSPHFHKSKTLDNKYMLGDEIGKGAYARVYKGLDLENGDFVAIKQVSLENIGPEDLNIIMLEIDLLKNLNHKNIVKYLGSLKTKTHLHIILEYVENGSLANIIMPNKFGPFPESLVAVYIAQVLEGLVYLHEHGVIHRDIKGANILTTKEGLVKLADFGVATKLTEVDVNTHSVVGTPYSVVGTPYWMAPEVIEMSGVCAASDIWSVGCTVIELLTCVPPYYDLQPMPALFRIVQDQNPPIPDGLSPDMTDFLLQCFKKDARQRPDAKILLSHHWIQNCRRALQPSLRHSGTLSCRNIEEDFSVDAETSPGHDPNNRKSPSAEKVEGVASEVEAENKEQLVSTEPVDLHGYSKDLDSRKSIVDGTKNPKDNVQPDLVPTFLIHSKDGSRESRMKEPVDRIHDGYGNLVYVDNKEAGIGPRSQDNHNSLQKATKAAAILGGNELSRFSDTPGNALLDDLFHPLDKITEDRSAEASTSAFPSHANPGNAYVTDAGKHDLASKLRATIAQKQMENEMGPADGGNLTRLMMGVLKDDVIDIDSLVFDEKLPAESLFPLQTVELSRLVASLRPEESDDVIVSACQKLVAFFNQHPEQKIVFVTQHALLPLMELLEAPRNRVIYSALQLANQIMKDNPDTQENACLLGMIPVVMRFAVDHPHEVRMEAAYFLQQLCQSSSLTLQMFIACRGIPVLVGFLEADYAKYREMVHLAIDGMWQIFKLRGSTPRNDFCHIAIKNGILIRLVNTLYSLNEATRLAYISGDGGVTLEGSSARARSGPLDSSHATFVQGPPPHSGPMDSRHPIFLQGDRPISGTKQTDCHSFRHVIPDYSLASAPEPPHLLPSHSQRSNANQSGFETSVSSRVVDPTSVDRVRETSATTSKEGENFNHWKYDHSRSEAEFKLTRSAEGVSNGFPTTVSTQQENVRPLFSLLEKKPPSRQFSGKLDYVRHLPGLERHESILPLLHASNERKNNGELDFLMAEFAEVSGRGRENGKVEPTGKFSVKKTNTKAGPSISKDTAASISGIASQTTSGVLSGSGVLNGRFGSTSSSGLLSHMVLLNTDVAREYLEKVADLLLAFAQADTTVKSYMCSQSLLSRLFQMFNRIEPPILLKILKCVNHLSADPNCLENLQRADAIKYLIPNLELKDRPLIDQIHHEVLNALFNLCKINKRRQEQAAENGIIPHLMLFVMSDSPLKQYALPLLCDMAHASSNSREQLRAHDGLDVYLTLLDDEYWSVTALDSIAVFLAHDNDDRKVEQALLKKNAVQKLVKFFQYCPEQHFVHILEPFLKIITKSSRINTILAVNGLTPLLIARLHHQDVIARLNLLKLIKAVYEHHPWPKQLIVENDLTQKLQNLIEEGRDGQHSGGQVLVKQMATSLLKVLNINTDFLVKKIPISILIKHRISKKKNWQ